MSSLSDILYSVTNKKDWYEKIFDSTITSTWKEEVQPEDSDNFLLVLMILQATAQGIVHDPECKWNDELCEGCKNDLLEEGKKDYYEQFGYNTYEEFKEDINIIYDDLHYELQETCDHKRCNCVGADYLLRDFIEYKDNSKVQRALKQLVAELEENVEVDYHPEIISPTETKKGIMRDLVHPSLYCYVKGVSAMKDGTVEKETEQSLRYQWLPSEVEILGDKVSFLSYINNFERDVRVVERAFSSFLPSLSKVLKRDIPERLQVIVKISTMTLQEGEIYEGGSWHIEGMPYERIVATCIQYIQVDKTLDSYLEFRKPTFINETEVDYSQGDEAYTRLHFGIQSHYDGEMNMNLGPIKCEEGKGVVFPNSLQHRVLGIKGPGKRAILAFFVVDPDNRIVSTEDVTRQQKVMSREEAEKHRVELMVQRKYFIDTINEDVYERPYCLCEH